MTAYVFIGLLVVSIFAGDMARRWWYETRWKRREKRPMRHRT